MIQHMILLPVPPPCSSVLLPLFSSSSPACASGSSRSVITPSSSPSSSLYPFCFPDGGVRKLRGLSPADDPGIYLFGKDDTNKTPTRPNIAAAAWEHVLRHWTYAPDHLIMRRHHIDHGNAHGHDFGCVRCSTDNSGRLSRCALLSLPDEKVMGASLRKLIRPP